MATNEYTTEPDGMKRCSKCQVVKSCTAFYTRRQRRNGLTSRCRECLAADRQVQCDTPLPEAQAVATQRCSRCTLVKPREAFYADRGKKQKIESQCKVCRAVKQVAYMATPAGKATRARAIRSAAHHASQRRFFTSAKGKALRRLQASRRRARRRQLADAFSARDEAFARDYWGRACAVCGDRAGLWKVIALDHWIPLSSPVCPGTIPGNMLPLCHARKGIHGAMSDCNLSKHVKNAQMWLMEKLGTRQAKRKAAEIERFFEAAIAYSRTEEQAG